MKFEITSVEFDHESALELIEIIKERINNMLVSDLELTLQSYEFKINELLIEFSVQFLPYTDYAQNGKEISKRNVDFSLQISNESGKYISYTVGKRYGYNEILQRYQFFTPIDIEEEIRKYYTI